MRSVLLLAWILSWTSVPSLYAMCVSTGYSDPIWSADQTAALIRRDSHGPEGGGEIAFLLVRLKSSSKAGEPYVFSSDFSPGNGSHPQRVTTEACSERVRSLNQSLSSLKFPVRLTENACQGSQRTTFLESDAYPRAEVLEEPEQTAPWAKKLGLPRLDTESLWHRKIFPTRAQTGFVVTDQDGTCSAKCVWFAMGASGLIKGACEPGR